MTKRKPDAVFNVWDKGSPHPTESQFFVSASVIRFSNDCLPSSPRVTHRILVYLKDKRA